MKSAFKKNDVKPCPFCGAICRDTNGIDRTSFMCGTVAQAVVEPIKWDRSERCVIAEKAINDAVISIARKHR